MIVRNVLRDEQAPKHGDQHGDRDIVTVADVDAAERARRVQRYRAAARRRRPIPYLPAEARHA